MKYADLRSKAGANLAPILDTVTRVHTICFLPFFSTVADLLIASSLQQNDATLACIAIPKVLVLLCKVNNRTN